MDNPEQETVLVWIDLETTGKRPVEDYRILEYAVVFTDLELNELSAREAVIPQCYDTAISQMDDYVTAMHSRNGLLDALRAFSARGDQDYEDNLRIASRDILADMFGLALELDKPRTEIIFVIAGNTVGFDRDYLEIHMPGLYEKLHYRQLDVSSYKVGFPNIFGTATSDKHRAMADIRDSIEQHRKMREIVVNKGLGGAWSMMST